MTRTSALALFVLLASAGAALAQNDASAPPGTNGAGTAQSSDAATNRQSGVATGLGSGRAKTEPSTSANGAINAETNTIDRKLKSICRGC